MYTSFVSLGSWCITAHHLKRSSIQRSKSPFDWTFTFYKPLYRLIEDDFQNFFALDNLEFTGGSVLDHGSGLRFMHAFTREADNTVSQATIEREYEMVRVKVDDLVERWRNRVRSPGKHLYIWAIMPGWMAGTPTREAAVAIRSLMRQRYPGHHFDLLVVGTQADDVDWQSDGVYLRRAAAYRGHDPDLDWIGDTDSWDRILAEFRGGPPMPHAIGQAGAHHGVTSVEPLDAPGFHPQRPWSARLKSLIGR